MLSPTFGIRSARNAYSADSAPTRPEGTQASLPYDPRPAFGSIEPRPQAAGRSSAQPPLRASTSCRNPVRASAGRPADMQAETVGVAHRGTRMHVAPPIPPLRRRERSRGQPGSFVYRHRTVPRTSSHSNDPKSPNRLYLRSGYYVGQRHYQENRIAEVQRARSRKITIRFVY